MRELNNQKCKTCRECKLSYKKDNRSEDIACTKGLNYDYESCQCVDKGQKCKKFIAKG